MPLHKKWFLYTYRTKHTWKYDFKKIKFVRVTQDTSINEMSTTFMWMDCTWQVNSVSCVSEHNTSLLLNCIYAMMHQMEQKKKFSQSKWKFGFQCYYCTRTLYTVQTLFVLFVWYTKLIVFFVYYSSIRRYSRYLQLNNFKTSFKHSSPLNNVKRRCSRSLPGYFMSQFQSQSVKTIENVGTVLSM